MIKYTYCTIAVGERYLKQAIQLAENLNKFSSNHNFIIVTNTPQDHIKNCQFYYLPKSETLHIRNIFNYNLKYYPIKIASELDYEYIIFIDSDWDLFNGFSEDKIFHFLNEINKEDLDFIFERPSFISGKNNYNTCFWRHKIDTYQLMSTDKYDHGHVPNEQFLVFKVNEKLKKFVKKWEELNKICVETQTNPFAEGVEIGISSVESNMKWSWGYLNIMSECFIFRANNGHYYSRF
jgi:hypothetical protein